MSAVSLPVVNVTQIGEYVRHHACERRFKLDVEARTLVNTLPYHATVFNALDPVLRENRSRRGYEEREAEVVSEHVMVFAPPVQRMVRIARCPFGHDAKAIGIRHDARPGHERAFPFRERWRAVRHSPAHEEMRDGTHYDDRILSGSGAGSKRFHASSDTVCA